MTKPAITEIQGQDTILTSDELAEILKISSRYIRVLADEQKIPHFKVGNRYRFRRNSILEWLETQEVKVVQ